MTHLKTETLEAQPNRIASQQDLMHATDSVVQKVIQHDSPQANDSVTEANAHL